ncbi:uncharacterized protein LOC132728870 [Ruditapes philippinarum]|uniref:uncharacterized protein LOC132728870 n=1 Tax=Ruditapes philippinarum TaxID=129788 RepID=UPI00295BA784|nr:uncharacterized protein LOC132728870 [Ruditapes philippinarum]
MNLQKLISTREGHRRIVQRKLAAIDQNEEMSSLEISSLIDYLTEKATIIKGLNEKIINQCDDIETEIVESEEYSYDLDLRIQKLSETYRKHTQDFTNNSSVDQEESPMVPRHTSSSTFAQHKLPKLTIPNFDGDLTNWQTFWDSYESSIHLNSTLSDVQKFNYLRSLVQGIAARCIDGFPLTNANYLKAVSLLRERFGQPQKIIHRYMQSLLELPRPSNNVVSLQCFYDKMETFIRGLESLWQSQESYGSLLIPIILEKLPGIMKQNMAREHRSVNWELQELRSAICKEISFMEAGISTSDIINREPDVHIPTASFFTGTRQSTNERKNERKKDVNFRKIFKKVCPFCNDEHSPNECRKVTSYESRIDIVKREHLCFNCLRKHQVSACRSTNRCRHCQRKHHSSICDKSAKQSNSKLNPNAASFTIPATSGVSNQPEAAILHSTTQLRHDVLLKTAVAQICSNIVSLETNILFDEGAQRSFITEELAEKLQIEQTGSEVVHLASFGDTSQRVRHMRKCCIQLITDDNEKICIDVLIVPKIAVPLRNINQNILALPYLHGLKLAHPVTNDRDFEISLLIGADSYWKIVQDKVIRGNGPTAVQSRLGYLLSGPLPVSNFPASIQHQLPVSTLTASTSQQPPVPAQETSTHLLNILTSSPDSFDIERFWKLESLGISQEEENPEATYLENYQRDSITYNNGRYTAKLPWKEDHATLPTNYDITKKRTENVIRRLRQDPSSLQTYGEIINDQEKRGFIEKVDEGITPQHKIHYIPHHGVKKDSVTTPIRIVYDCSCHQSRNQPSLNDCLKSTPPELNDLTQILIRFRLHRYAVTTDIEKAFLQIQLAEEDRDVTRFLWLSDPKNPDSTLITYRFKAVLFGATCSPFILNATILKHLASNSDVWVSSILRRDLYVDNVLSSFEDENQALAYFHDSRKLMSSANFNLRSWNSNSQKLRNLALNYDVQDRDKITKILGMRWNTETDMLTFQQTYIPVTDTTTKREILRQTSKIFDPLGLLSPVTVRAKIILQQIWEEKV